MRWLVVASFALAGCSADTYGLLADDVVDDTGIDGSSDDTSAGDDTKPLFGEEDTAAAPSDSGPAKVDSGPAKVDSGSIAVDSSVLDSGTTDSVDTSVLDTDTDSGVSIDSGMVADSIEPDAPAETAVPDTAPGTPFTSAPNKVVCADGAGGTKLCGAGQTCCGTSSGYACSSSCSSFSKDYHCDERADCASTEVCCVKLNILLAYDGSACTPKDLCFTTVLCQTDAECGSGKCNAFKPSGATYTMGRCG